MLPHLASRLFGTPLLVHRAKLDVILSVLGPRIGLPGAEMAAAIPAPRQVSPAPPGIAVIPVYGSLLKRSLGLEAASGLTSYAEIGGLIDVALADPQVSGILLDIDSPGGEVNGCFELARKVRETARIKPVWAIANDTAFSAAYALGCAAQRLFVTETGGVGSIGVIALHVDQSVKDTQDGLRYTAITAGAHKNDYSPHEPLDAAARAALQTEVDRLYGLFVDHVAALRGLSAESVRATEAALYFGPNAVAAGLADAVGTLQTALQEFSDALRTQGGLTPQSRVARRFEAQEVLPMSAETPPEVPEAHQALPAASAADLLAQARDEAARSAQAIAEMCQIAGCPERAAEFIAAGRTEQQVRAVLLEARAQRSAQVELSDQHAPSDWAGASLAPEQSPVVAAVKKLTHKE